MLDGNLFAEAFWVRKWPVWRDDERRMRLWRSENSL